MQNPPTEREKLLADIERMLAEAPDEAGRRDLERLRASLNSPEMVDMARALETAPRRSDSDLVLHFHAPLLPVPLTATGCVLTCAISLYAARIISDPPPACTLNIQTPSLAASTEAFATVFGMSWNFRSRKILAPASTISLTNPGPSAVNNWSPILNAPGAPMRASPPAVPSPCIPACG